MKPDDCPDLETLENLLLGDLPGLQRELLGEHLLHCEKCTAAADTITASDELTEAIRARRVFDGDEKVLVQVIERGKQLRTEFETFRPEGTLASDMGQRQQDADGAREPHTDDDTTTDELIDFLRPAERPDEIGRLGDYRVLEVMGVGGMGVVFQAEDPKLERLVALKAMKPAVAASKSARDRFLREARATASIAHDNIVHIYQVGEDRNIPFIAMQLLRGESLQARLKREEKLPQREVARIGREVAAGLAAAHKRDLIHRDIKPDNIWIEEETGRAKILDFGLVRSARDDAGLTQSGMVVGTPRYMAPEQAQGQEVDHRVDLFSLGNVLYHLASGQTPFDDGSPTATLIAVAHKDPEPIENVCPQLQPDLTRLITRLLAKDRCQRPQSADAVVEALAEIEKNLDAEQVSQDKRPLVDEFETTELPLPRKQHAKPQHKSRKPILFGVGVIALALAAILGLWSAGVIFKVETKDGTLVVKVMGNDFEASIKGKRIKLQNIKTFYPIDEPLVH